MLLGQGCLCFDLLLGTYQVNEEWSTYQLVIIIDRKHCNFEAHHSTHDARDSKVYGWPRSSSPQLYRSVEEKWVSLQVQMTSWRYQS